MNIVKEDLLFIVGKASDELLDVINDDDLPINLKLENIGDVILFGVEQYKDEQMDLFDCLANDEATDL